MKFFTIWLFFFWSLVHAETQSYEGEALLESKIIYREHHQVESDNSRILKSVTQYKNKEGKVIATLKNDYALSLNSPEHVFEDLNRQTMHGVRYVDGEVVMFRKDGNEKEKTKLLKKDDYKGKLLVGGQGLHYYLVTNLEEVIKKGRLDLKFLIPGRLDAYDFYLKVVKAEAAKVHFEIEIDNWFLKLFAPKLKLIYERSTARLLYYKGLSNVKNEKDELMNVEINYKYPAGK